MNNDNFIEKLQTILKENEPIEASSIPEIDLYMDQVLTLLNEKLKNQKRKSDEKLLTKTMINNYTKDQILPSPKNKKYSKEHVMMLILIYNMKSCLSISDIKNLINYVNSESDIHNIYKMFTNLQETLKDSINNEFLEIKSKIENLPLNAEKEEEFLYILSLIIDANYKKQLAEKMIDDFFLKY